MLRISRNFLEALSGKGRERERDGEKLQDDADITNAFR